MAGSINSTSTYTSVGNAAVKTTKPRLVLVYDRDAVDRGTRTPRISEAPRRPKLPEVPRAKVPRARVPRAKVPRAKVPRASRAQNRVHGVGAPAGVVSAALDVRALLRIFVIAAIVLCCSAAFEGMRSAKINQMLDSAPVEEVKAVTGDTLWSIAEQHCSNDIPTEDVVTWIRSHNGLSSAMITPGQRISVPIVAE